MGCDLHIHSCFSFDSNTPFESICQTAVRRGLRTAAMTDHCDMTDAMEGRRSYLKNERRREESFRQARQAYPQLELLYGVEIGNAIDMPEETGRFLEERRFDFVIGAIHFLPDGSDIYRLPYHSGEEIGTMFRQYFRSMMRLVELGGFDSLAHLDYPLRVLKGKIPVPTVLDYRKDIEPILAELVRKGIALEVNTRGTYDWQHRVGPEDWVLRRYRELGGEYVTIGSDAHTAAAVGAGFAEAAEALRRCGFSAYTVYRERRPVQIGL